LRRLMKKTASALEQSPETPLGKRITGRPDSALIDLTVSSRARPAAPTDPPTMMASVPPFAAALAILPAASGPWESGSMRVRWAAPAVSTAVASIPSTGPIMRTSAPGPATLCSPWT